MGVFPEVLDSFCMGIEGSGPKTSVSARPAAIARARDTRDPRTSNHGRKRASDVINATGALIPS